MPDKADLVFYGGISLMLITSTWAMYESNQDRKQFVAECHAKGGEPIQGAHRNYYCIDKKVVL